MPRHIKRVGSLTTLPLRASRLDQGTVAYYPSSLGLSALATRHRVALLVGLIALLSAGFILTGFPTILVGPILPTFISRWNLTDSQAGLFFTVQFAASLAAVWITTGLTAWRGYRPGLVIGYVLTGTGAEPPKMTDPARGTVTGEALIFNSRDDSVKVEGEGRKTTTETTAPK